MKNKIKLLMIILLLTIISFVIGFSYAYFDTIVIGNDIASSKSTTLGTLQLNYSGLDYVSFSNAKPGDTESFVFSVSNTGTLPVNSYEINFSRLTNTFINNELVYEMTCLSSDAIPCSNKAQTPVPTSAGLALVGSSIAPGTTHTYDFDLTFLEAGVSQNYNQEKFKFLTFNE